MLSFSVFQEISAVKIDWLVSKKCLLQSSCLAGSCFLCCEIKESHNHGKVNWFENQRSMSLLNLWLHLCCFFGRAFQIKTPTKPTISWPSLRSGRFMLKWLVLDVLTPVCDVRISIYLHRRHRHPHCDCSCEIQTLGGGTQWALIHCLRMQHHLTRWALCPVQNSH